MISWANFLNALLATWIISAIVFMVSEAISKSEKGTARATVKDTILWPIPAALTALMLILNLLTDFVTLLMDPWFDDDDEDGEDGGTAA